MSTLFILFGGALLGAASALLIGGEQAIAIMGVGMLVASVCDVLWRDA